MSDLFATLQATRENPLIEIQSADSEAMPILITPLTVHESPDFSVLLSDASDLLNAWAIPSRMGYWNFGDFIFFSRRADDWSIGLIVNDNWIDHLTDAAVCRILFALAACAGTDEIAELIGLI